jgi:DNA-binding CsgD family transcriptional regulator
MPDQLAAGREAFARDAWAEAYTFLIGQPPELLGAPDFERLAIAAYLIGDDDESARAWEGAHRGHVTNGDQAEAARCSFWLGLCFLLRGEMAQAGGWLTRTERIVETGDLDCAAAGYLLIPALLGALEDGDPIAAAAMAARATEVGDRFHDPDLRAFGGLGHGQALLAQGDTAAGTAHLDEVMVSVTAGEVGPITSGIVYCAVVLECMRIFDLARATEWTRALSAWCDRQPDLVPYRGQCLVHRAQLQQAAGDWRDAITTIASARRRLVDPPHPALGLAYYQQAELHRLVGAFDEAELDYREAGRSGYQPVPGLALLELGRGDGVAAAATIRRALQEVGDQLERPLLLAAAVEIYRATGDAADARVAAEELAVIAAGSRSEVLGAIAALAMGTVHLSEGDPAAALTHLRAAAAAWQHLRMPYEAARTAVMLGLSCAALGDRTSAALEFGNATDAFKELGAKPDLDRLQALTGGLTAPGAPVRARHGTRSLSGRECEVLVQVTAGKTNREIAAELGISQHTVGRHLENIFAKLGVTSRAAATAYAYEHDLV